MRPFLLSQRLLGAGALASAILALVTGLRPWSRLLGAPEPDALAGAGGRAISYLREVRPILTQHCFQCHGPDEAARKARLRLDLKDEALAQRDGLHVIAPGNLD